MSRIDSTAQSPPVYSEDCTLMWRIIGNPQRTINPRMLNVANVELLPMPMLPIPNIAVLSWN